MAPKFKGNSDDWLDDQSSRRSGKGTVISKKKKADALDSSEANATVAEVFPRQCRVRLDETGEEILCGYRRASVLGHAAGHAEEGERDRSPVAVGDRVQIERSSPDSGTVKGICARRNLLARPAPGRDRTQKKVRQVIAANVDVLVIVASVGEPEFSPGLVDRFLIAAESAGIHPVICVSKLDLLNGSERPWEMYADLGYEVFPCCAKKGQGTVQLQERLEGLTAVFCGHSGVGKTSLLRVLLGTELGKVGAVSEATGKGRHTTSSAVLLEQKKFSAKTAWIDTPGVREFGLMNLEPETLPEFFPEFKELVCSTQGCLHYDQPGAEPGCLAHSLPRYPSYCRILESLLAGEN
ncbi:MAG TPA: ribosome small subunit-dependent GTPase A [Bdellovibrionales bacterium]|nr:ribosome small subunit-dependent GTPase A [Bdellovibrionales bacterium]